MRAIQLPVPQAAAVPGVVDRQIWSFYDFQTYAAAGQANLSFFQTPTGSGGRTKEDTNFPGAGSLPNGMNFVLQELQFLFIPGAAVTPGSFGAEVAPNFLRDVYAVGSRGHVQLEYSSKLYVDEGPLMRFPPDARLAGFAAAADATTAAANLQTLVNYGQWAGKPFRVADLNIAQQVNLNITVSWPNGVVALPSTVAGRLGCVMRGVLARSAQ